MSNSTIPPVRVDRAFRDEMEKSLNENETLSSFIQTSVRAEIERRKMQQEFLERGLDAIEKTIETDNGIPADHVIKKLEDRWVQAKRQHGLSH